MHETNAKTKISKTYRSFSSTDQHADLNVKSVMTVNTVVRERSVISDTAELQAKYGERRNAWRGDRFVKSN